MAVIRPFSCIRPTMENAAVVASRPYDVFSEEEARQAVGRNPHSILAITRPETQFPAGMDPTAPEVYAAAGERLEAWIRQGGFWRMTGSLPTISMKFRSVRTSRPAWWGVLRWMITGIIR